MATVIRSSAPSACGRERLRSNRHPVTHPPSMLRGIMPIETGAAPAWFPRIPDSGTGPRRGVPDCLRRKSGAEMDLLLQFAGIRSPAIFKVTKNEKLSPSIREWRGLEGLLHIIFRHPAGPGRGWGHRKRVVRGCRNRRKLLGGGELPSFLGSFGQFLFCVRLTAR